MEHSNVANNTGMQQNVNNAFVSFGSTSSLQNPSLQQPQNMFQLTATNNFYEALQAKILQSARRNTHVGDSVRRAAAFMYNPGPQAIGQPTLPQAPPPTAVRQPTTVTVSPYSSQPFYTQSTSNTHSHSQSRAPQGNEYVVVAGGSGNAGRPQQQSSALLCSQGGGRLILPQQTSGVQDQNVHPTAQVDRYVDNSAKVPATSPAAPSTLANRFPGFTAALVHYITEKCGQGRDAVLERELLRYLKSRPDTFVNGPFHTDDENVNQHHNDIGANSMAVQGQQQLASQVPQQTAGASQRSQHVAPLPPQAPSSARTHTQAPPRTVPNFQNPASLAHPAQQQARAPMPQPLPEFVQGSSRQKIRPIAPQLQVEQLPVQPHLPKKASKPRPRKKQDPKGKGKRKAEAIDLTEESDGDNNTAGPASKRSKPYFNSMPTPSASTQTGQEKKFYFRSKAASNVTAPPVQALPAPPVVRQATVPAPNPPGPIIAFDFDFLAQWETPAPGPSKPVTVATMKNVGGSGSSQRVVKPAATSMIPAPTFAESGPSFNFGSPSMSGAPSREQPQCLPAIPTGHSSSAATVSEKPSQPAPAVLDRVVDEDSDELEYVD